MQPKIIGVRELRTNLKKIENAVKKGAYFVVTHHKKPIFEIHAPKKKIGKSLLDEFKHIRFSSGDPDLSKKIDEIVYDL